MKRVATKTRKSNPVKRRKVNLDEGETSDGEGDEDEDEDDHGHIPATRYTRLLSKTTLPHQTKGTFPVAVTMYGMVI